MFLTTGHQVQKLQKTKIKTTFFRLGRRSSGNCFSVEADLPRTIPPRECDIECFKLARGEGHRYAPRDQRKPS